MAHSNATAPTTDPTITRRYQCTNITTTKTTINNKEWGFRFWETEGIVQYFWGSVGKEASNSPKTIYGSLDDAEKMAASKTNPRNKPESRYTEVQLQSKATPPPQLALAAVNAPIASHNIHPDVLKAVSYIFGTANQHIKTYLQGTIDALSVDQLNEGRKVIVEARNLLPSYQAGSRNQDLLNTMNHYYNTIPTIISKVRLSADDRVKMFYDDLHQYEDRIDQLEAALSTYQYSALQTHPIDPVVQQYQSLGIELTALPQSDTNYEAANRFIHKTLMNEKAKIHRIYAVVIPAERQAFNQWATSYSGDANHTMFFHGTARYNVQHILRTGLIIPKTAANGSRMGRGIYFAPNSARSLMYTDYKNENGYYVKNGEYWMMFINQVALGKSKEYKTENQSLIAAPQGYDSTYCSVSFGGRGGEYIVYKTIQQTIRMLIMFEPK